MRETYSWYTNQLFFVFKLMSSHLKIRFQPALKFPYWISSYLPQKLIHHSLGTRWMYLWYIKSNLFWFLYYQRFVAHYWEHVLVSTVLQRQCMVISGDASIHFIIVACTCPACLCVSMTLTCTCTYGCQLLLEHYTPRYRTQWRERSRRCYF